MKLSVVIPGHNEEGCIENTVLKLYEVLTSEAIDHEILVINDHSTDQTEEILKRISEKYPSIRYENNSTQPGFGLAVRYGLDRFTGDAVAVYMADASDRPEDLVRYFRTLETEPVDCVFGTRFSRKSKVYDYPLVKLTINRIVNFVIQVLFGFRYNDTTNAFKLYRKEVIEGTRPHLSHHFNLTVELPLKAIVRGYKFTYIPNDWINRTTGESKLKIKEMGSRYLFIIMYCLIEKWLSRGDYYQKPTT